MQRWTVHTIYTFKDPRTGRKLTFKALTGSADVLYRLYADVSLSFWLMPPAAHHLAI